MKPFTQKQVGKALFLVSQIAFVALASMVSLPAAQAKVSAPPSNDQALFCDTPTIGEEVMHGKTFVVSRLLIKAKPERVWQILADYGNAARVFPILKKCELIENRGTTKITKHEIAPSGLPGTFEYVLEVHETAPTRMEWHRLKGDFHDVDGYWKLEATDYGRHTMVVYASYVNGGILMPQVLIRRQFHKDMPEALLALKRKAELDNRIAVHRAEVVSTQ